MQGEGFGYSMMKFQQIVFIFLAFDGKGGMTGVLGAQLVCLSHDSFRIHTT
jgi:hypothetical protein